MTLPLPWNVPALDGTSGQLTVLQTAFRLLMPAAAQVMADLVAVDTFRRPDSASLDNAESGQAWEILEGAFTLASLKAVASTTGVAVVNTGLTDVDAQCVITPASGAPQLAFRSGATTADRLSAVLDTAGGSFIVQKRDTNVLTTLGSDPTSIPTGAPYTVQVVAIGNDIVATLHDGTEIIASVPVTLTGGDITKFGTGTTLTRVGFRNSGVATYGNLLVRRAQPIASAGGTETIASAPAGSVFFAAESGGTYVRGSARTDIIVIFIGVSNPSAFMVNNDHWSRTNV